MLVVHRRLRLPRQPPGHADPDHRGPGGADRHLRGDAGARLLAQHRLAARARARHRHRRRRRHRRGRERRAGDGGEPRHDAGRGGDRKAMGEITGAIVAITLVLLSVFVPVAFIPGISGQLFQQFAVAVSVSMVISAINALTLSPALCAIILKPHHGPRGGVLGWISRGIDGRATATPGSPAPSRGARSSASLLLVGAFGADRLARRARADRVPARRGPGSLLRGDPAARGSPRSTAPSRWQGQVEAMLARPARGRERRHDHPAISFLDGLAKSNAAFSVVTLQDPSPSGRRPGPTCRGDHRAGERARGGDPRGAGLRLQPAADHRPRHRLGLRVSAARPPGPLRPPSLPQPPRGA